MRATYLEDEIWTDREKAPNEKAARREETLSGQEKASNERNAKCGEIRSKAETASGQGSVRRQERATGLCLMG